MVRPLALLLGHFEVVLLCRVLLPNANGRAIIDQAHWGHLMRVARAIARFESGCHGCQYDSQVLCCLMLGKHLCCKDNKLSPLGQLDLPGQCVCPVGPADRCLKFAP